jgi:5-oxoprolinase (ATP-hydrolysing) subunit A
MTVIDINIDAGESYGAWSMGDDAGTFPHATSVNLACGFHAGDPASMFAAARLALEHGLAIGAHPGLPDLVGFGRRALQVTPEQAYNDVVYQVGALVGVLGVLGAPLHHVKLHGAFSSHVSEDPAVADGVLRAVRDIDRELPIVVLPGSQLARAAGEIGQPHVPEGYPERGYAPGGLLARRGTPGAIVTDVGEAARRAVGMAVDGEVAAVDGTPIAFRPRTLCIHGDNPHAAAIAAAVRAALEAAGVELAAF